MSTSASSPIPLPELEKLTVETCRSVFANAHAYEHSKTQAWNSTVITTLLSALIRASTPPSSPQCPYKYVVTSTIIQHTTPGTVASSSSSQTQPLHSQPTDGYTGRESAGEGDPANGGGKAGGHGSKPGKRGMHAATGAFWNKERDGMWSYKYEGEEREYDVVVGVIWVGI